MNDNTKANENDTFTREEIREACQKVKGEDYCPFFIAGVAR